MEVACATKLQSIKAWIDTQYLPQITIPNLRNQETTRKFDSCGAHISNKYLLHKAGGIVLSVSPQPF